nr:hypothetical protein [Tanacetum cinerariifolium]
SYRSGLGRCRRHGSDLGRCRRYGSSLGRCRRYGSGLGRWYAVLVEKWKYFRRGQRKSLRARWSCCRCCELLFKRYRVVTVATGSTNLLF